VKISPNHRSNALNEKKEMSKNINIFISHSWNMNDYYIELVKLLESGLGSSWNNLSISCDNAVTIATGYEQIPQRIKFLRDSLEELESQKQSILDNRLVVFSNFENQKNIDNELRKCEIIDSLIAQEWEQILNPNFSEKIKYLEKIKLKSKKFDIGIEKEKSSQLLLEFQNNFIKIDLKIEKLDREINKIKGAIDEVKIDILASTGKRRDDVMVKFPNLALAIRNKLLKSHVVLVVVETSSAFRSWIEYEYQESFLLKKPIFGVLHPQLAGQIPPDLKHYNVVPVNWEKEQIVNIVKKYH